MSRRSKGARFALFAVRLAVSAGLLAWVFHRFVRPQELVDLARRTDGKLLALGLAIEALPVAITTWRWHLLLRPVGLTQGPGRTFHFNYLGLFFNNFLLGLTGGDLVKAILIARGSDRKAGAVLTVFVDRLVGLLTLAGIAAVACAVRFGRPEYRLAAAIVWGFLGAFTLFCLLWFNPWLSGRLHRLTSRLPGGRILRELDEAARAYGGRKAILAAAAGLSLASHACSLGAAWVFARALGSRIDLVEILVYYPVIMMIVSIPVSVGSWGVGEAAFIGFFEKVGVPRPTAVALSLLVRLGQAAWTLPGGLFLLFDPAERKAVAEAEEEADDQS